VDVPQSRVRGRLGAGGHLAIGWLHQWGMIGIGRQVSVGVCRSQIEVESFLALIA